MPEPLKTTELNDVVTRQDLRSLVEMIRQNFILRKEMPDFDIELYVDPVTKKFYPEAMPSCVDEVIEGETLADFPEKGESGVMYVCLDDSEIYRWSGTRYVKISDSSKSAQKLTTARTINGVEFDGTKDIVIHLTEDDNLASEDVDKIFNASLQEAEAAKIEGGMTTEDAENICAETIGSFPELVDIKK